MDEIDEGRAVRAPRAADGGYGVQAAIAAEHVATVTGLGPDRRLYGALGRPAR